MWSLIDSATALALIGYAVGAAAWAAALRTDVRVIRAELSSLKEFKDETDKDSQKQWEKFEHHSDKISDHGERLTRVESRVTFHDSEIDRLNERIGNE